MPQALAKTVTIQILSTGFSPASPTIAAGDTVVWKNSDTAKHQVVADDGSFQSPLLGPGQTYSHRFFNTGTYAFHGGIHPNLKGSVVVASVTLVESRRTATYGTSLLLSGDISTGKGGEQVTIRAKPFDQPARVITVTTAADGSWSLRVFPFIQTTYQASWNNLKSGRTIVFVRPRLALQKAGRGFALQVFDVHRLINNYVWITRWSRTQHQYTHVAKIFLNPSNRAVIWVARFRLHVRRGTELRAFLPSYQAGPGYSYGQSNVVVA